LSEKKRAKNEVFVVMVNHDEKYKSEMCHVPLITRDPAKAVKMAKRINTLGYEFNFGETGVSVCRMEVGRSYRKNELMWFLGESAPSTAVFVRTRGEDGKWTEEWFDEKIQRLVEKQIVCAA